VKEDYYNRLFLARSYWQAVFSPNLVIQPDISVVCNPEKLAEAGCVGAPDLVVKIVSRYSLP
jgi:Uma2 family endonuclease